MHFINWYVVLLTSQISQALADALNFMKLDKVPLMKELTSKYKSIALLCHPDKNGGSKEATEIYQKLVQSYRIIADYIVENDTSAKEDSGEENDHIYVYNNFDKKNLYSHTIFIENSLLKRIL